MRIKNWNVDADELIRDERPKVKRFRETTVKKPTTRADLVRQAGRVREEFPDRSSAQAVAYDSWRADR